MNIKTLMIAATFTLFPACGQDKIDEVELERDSAREQANSEKLEKQGLATAIDSAFETANNFWMFRGVYRSYESAVSLCEEVGMSLPTEEQFLEYREARKGTKTLESVDKQGVHILEKTVDEEKVAHVICRRDKV